MTKMILPDNTETRALAAKIIAAGGIVAFRTDTFYGLGADPFNRAALLKLKALKGREEGKPILVARPGSDAAQSFRKLSSLIVNAGVVAQPKRSGVLRRLLPRSA